MMTAFSQELPADFPTLHTMKTGETGKGYTFLSVSTDVEGIGYYVMMVDDDGVPVRYRKLAKDDYSYDFKVQPNGLTSYAQFLSHHSYTGGGNCIHMLMDEEMNFVDSVQLGNGYIAEAHDFQLLPNGHYLAFGYYLTEMDLSELVDGGYPNALVSGGVVQELDADKKVVWQWRSWDHYDPENYDFGSRAARQTVSQFHLNTINLDYDDNILLATPSWTKKIDRKSGQILWHLGGSENEFSFVGVDSLEGVGDVTGHAFYLLENGNYLIYDNGPRRGAGTSETHEYRIDQVNKIAEKIMTFIPDTAIAAWHRGNAQRLPNGNTMVGWGGASGDHIPTATEFDPDGNIVFKAWFDDPVTESYRAFRFPYPPEHKYEADIIEVGLGNTYELLQGDTLAIGVTVKIEDLTTVGYSELNFTTHDYAPRFPTFTDRAPMVLPARLLMEEYSVNYVEGEIRFQVDTFNISDPDSITVYYRPLAEGTPFIPLPTTFNPVSRELVADFNGTGEFIFGYPDIEHGVFAPMTVAPAYGSLENYLHPVGMEWSPQGFYSTFSLQLSADPGFGELLLDTTGMDQTIFQWSHQDVNDTVYWRVKTHNDAGESPWSDTAYFVTSAPHIELTAPAGEEIWQRGMEHFIQWEDNIEEEVVLELFHDGSKLSTIDTAESRSAYQWAIPFDLDSACGYHIRISSVADPAIHDVSTLTFSINDSSCTGGEVADVKLLAPNGGELFYPGDTVQITWANSSGETLTLDLYGNEAIMETIATGADGSQTTWIVPQGMEAGSSYRIVLTSEGSLALTDAGNSDFTIAEGFPSSIRPERRSGTGFQLYPNPATREITLGYSLEREAEVEISIFNLQGMEMEIIHLPGRSPGNHTFNHSVEQYPAGIYLVKFRIGVEETGTLLQIQ